jgi:hypothetical protein
MAKRGRKKKNKEDVDMKKMADAMHETQEIREGFPVYQDKGRPVTSPSQSMDKYFTSHERVLSSEDTEATKQAQAIRSINRDKTSEKWPVLSSGEIVTVHILDCAEEVGFTIEQIKTFADLKSLVNAIYRINPKLGIDLIPRYEPPRPEPTSNPVVIFEEKTVTFEVKARAGIMTVTRWAAREQEEIERYFNRHGIRKITLINIDRNLVPDKNGNFISTVKVNYKEKKE